MFDLVILDMIMPEMNGRECFFKMKEIDKQVRIILSSGFADEDDIRDMTRAGLCGSITKPFSTTELSRMALNVINTCEKA
jgi:DNA-binding NtrC family response regulator